MARVALVTGGTRGIGRAVAARLLQDGFKVAVLCRSGRWGEDEPAGLDAPVFACDVAAFDACAAAVAQVEAQLGPVEVLVNDAGVTADAALHKMSQEQWRQVLSVDLDSMFNMCRQVVGGMRDRGFGRIINIASINGQKGQMGQVNYSAAKAGELGFTKALAQESARSGITVNAICPGPVETDLFRALPEDWKKRKLNELPIGRAGSVDEIAPTAVLLASEEGAYYVGATMNPNGGDVMI